MSAIFDDIVDKIKCLSAEECQILLEALKAYDKKQQIEETQTEKTQPIIAVENEVDKMWHAGLEAKSLEGEVK